LLDIAFTFWVGSLILSAAAVVLFLWLMRGDPEGGRRKAEGGKPNPEGGRRKAGGGDPDIEAEGNR
jgi:hypothetical protein